ncbi:hypothetical protein [Skermanella mucosa]|nr:hypothetical protein [Skermanella mucosa]
MLAANGLGTNLTAPVGDSLTAVKRRAFAGQVVPEVPFLEKPGLS